MLKKAFVTEKTRKQKSKKTSKQKSVNKKTNKQKSTAKVIRIFHINSMRSMTDNFNPDIKDTDNEKEKYIAINKISYNDHYVENALMNIYLEWYLLLFNESLYYVLNGYYYYIVNYSVFWYPTQINLFL